MPQYLHGGIALAVLDEAMAWATIAIAGCFAVTKEANARFHRPLRVTTPYEVRARVLDDDGELRCEAEIVDAKGQQRVTASAVFTALGPAQAVDAIGSAPQGDDARYIRPTGSSGEAGPS